MADFRKDGITLYRRKGTQNWFCRFTVVDKQYNRTTKQAEIDKAWSIAFEIRCRIREACELYRSSETPTRLRKDGITIYTRPGCPKWSCRFSVNGIQYKRTTKQTDIDKAWAHAFELRSQLTGTHSFNRTLKHQVLRELQRQVRGKVVSLDGALQEFLKKPRRAPLRRRRKTQIESAWYDFTCYLSDMHAKVDEVSEITVAMAEGYVNHIREHGRYKKSISYQSQGRMVDLPLVSTRLSARTINVYHSTCQSILRSVEETAGIDRNPFGGIVRMAEVSVSRKAFTPEQLTLIAERSRDDHPMIFFLFCVGSSTGLREGDICTLSWKSLTSDLAWLQTTVRKTKKTVKIPVMPALKELLLRYLENKDDDYVYPELANLYLGKPDTVSSMVKQFLEDACGIETTRQPPDRDRRVSILDVHSLRHTFCYMAGLNNVPLPIVQNIVGHMTATMTEHYMSHAHDQDKVHYMQSLPSYFGGAPPKSRKQELIDHAKSLQLDEHQLDMLCELIARI